MFTIKNLPMFAVCTIIFNIVINIIFINLKLKVIHKNYI